MGGLYDLGIVGASDSHMMKTFTNYDNNYIKKTISDGYKRSLVEYEDRVGTLTVSYIPGGIKHYFHGYRKDRKYIERWSILTKNGYDPYKHIIKDEKWTNNS